MVCHYRHQFPYNLISAVFTVVIRSIRTEQVKCLSVDVLFEACGTIMNIVTVCLRSHEGRVMFSNVYE